MSTRGTRLNPTEFPLTTERALQASTRGLDPKDTYDGFCDYWTALPGVKATKLDWDATWRNWVKRQLSFMKPWQLKPVVVANARTAKDQADIAALHARRKEIGIGGFRDINPGESVTQYRMAQDAAWTESRDKRLRLVK